MDYFLGLRIIITLSVLGIAVLIGSKMSFLGCPSCLQSEVKQDKAPDQSLGQEKKKLKDDFWDRLTRSRS